MVLLYFITVTKSPLGSVEGSYRARMDLADQLREELGYEWLAESVYKSCFEVLEGDAGREVDVLGKLALLEESRGTQTQFVYFECEFMLL